MFAFLSLITLASCTELSGRSLLLYKALDACKEQELESCVDYSLLYISELREFEPRLSGVYDDIEAFIVGTLNGMRKDPEMRSECIIETEEIFMPWGNLLSNLEEIVTTGNPIYLFDLPVSVNQVLSSAVTITEACSLRTLSTTVQESFTNEGFGRLLLNLALNYNETVADIDQILTSLSKNKYEEAGTYLGEIISILLNFYF